jgi:hypothetical protein
VYPSREPIAGQLRQVNLLDVAAAYRTSTLLDGDNGPFTVKQRNRAVGNNDVIAVRGAKPEVLRMSSVSDTRDQDSDSH